MSQNVTYERDSDGFIADAMMMVALFATALAAGAALAHALALPNELAMSRERYFVSQSIYLGWDQFIILLVLELAAIGILLFHARQAPRLRRPAKVALICLATTLAIFAIWSYPANMALENWTKVGADGASLRAQFVYSHLACAGLQLIGLCALIRAALAPRDS